MKPFSPDPDIREHLRQGIMALGSTTQERAEALGYGRKRVQHFEAGLFPSILFRFAQAGLIRVVEPTPNGSEAE